MSFHLWARIRPTSKYADQDPGKPFLVTLNDDDYKGYIWKGGPGGQYRHSDLQLMTNVDWSNELAEIPLFANGEQRAYQQLILDEYQQLAEQGRLYPDEFDRWSAEVIQRLQAIASTAHETHTEEDDE